MGRVEDNRKILEVWRDVGSKSKNFDEMNARLLAQQNAILADISRSLAVIADNSYLNNRDFDKVFDNVKRSGSEEEIYDNIRRINNIIRSGSNERSGSDDGEEKGL